MKPYPDQLEAVEAAIRAHRGVLVLPTGSGKSVVTALLVQALQVKTLIVVPTLELKTQLRASFLKWFGGTPNITIENIDAKALMKPASYDCLIVDEAHCSASRKYRELNAKAWNGIYYRFFFTATPFRNKTEEQILLQSVTGDVIYSLPYDRAVERGYIVPLQVFHKRLPLTKMTGNDRNWHSVNSELIVNNVARNELIVNMIATFESVGASTLVLVKEVKHGENIQRMLASRGLDIALVTGETDDNRLKLLEFNLKERTTLIATGVLGMGVDTKPCEYVILAAGGKSKPQLIQNIGRCLRTSPGKTVGTAIIFQDRSHKFLIKHFNETQKSLAEEYGLRSVDIDANS